MSQDRLIAASDRNFFDGWRAMAAAAGGLVHEADGILVAAPAAGPIWVNLLFVTKPLDDPERRLAETFALLDERSIPFMVRIRDGLDASTEDALTSMGLKYTDSIPGMALDPIPADGGREVDLDVREITDDARFAQFVTITTSSFELGEESGPRLLPPALRKTPHTFWYVGYLTNKPVAASHVEVLEDQAAGINFIGTLDGHRGRGYGEAMTWQAVNRGKQEGCNIAVLQASEAGQPVYERMGFRVVAGYKTFVRPEWIG